MKERSRPGRLDGDGQPGRLLGVDDDVLAEAEVRELLEHPAAEVVVADRADQPRRHARLDQRERRVGARPADPQVHVVDERRRTRRRDVEHGRQQEVHLHAPDDGDRASRRRPSCRPARGRGSRPAGRGAPRRTAPATAWGGSEGWDRARRGSRRPCRSSRRSRRSPRASGPAAARARRRRAPRRSRPRRTPSGRAGTAASRTRPRAAAAPRGRAARPRRRADGRAGADGVEHADPRERGRELLRMRREPRERGVHRAPAARPTRGRCSRAARRSAGRASAASPCSRGWRPPCRPRGRAAATRPRRGRAGCRRTR